MDLKSFLKSWRDHASLTQTVAAEMLGLPITTYQGLEQGRSYKNEKMLRLAIEALGFKG